MLHPYPGVPQDPEFPNVSTHAARDFTGWKNSLPVEARAPLDAEIANSTDPEKTTRIIIDRIWLSERTGYDLRFVHDHHEAVRATFGKGTGMENLWKDDEKFHQYIVAHTGLEQAEHEMLYGSTADTGLGRLLREESAASYAYESALRNFTGDRSEDRQKDMLDAYIHWQMKAYGKVGWRSGGGWHQYLGKFQTMYARGLADRRAADAAFAKILPILKYSRFAGKHYTTGLESSFDRAVDIMRPLPLHVRDLVFQSIATEPATPAPEASYRQSPLGDDFHKTVERSTITLGRSIGNAAEKVWNYHGDKLNGTAGTRVEEQILKERLIQASLGKFDPVKRDTLWKKIELGALEMAPVMATAAIPWVGPAALAGGFASDAENRLVEEGVPLDQARGMALVIGPAQAVLMRANLRVLQKAPGFGSWLRRYGSHSALMAAARTVATAAEGTALNAATIYTAPVIQEAASWWDREVPGVKWADVHHEVWATSPDTFLAMMPWAMLGAGRATAADFRGADALVRSPEAMRMLGYSPSHIAAVGLAAPGEAVALFRALWRERVPVLKEDGKALMPGDRPGLGIGEAAGRVAAEMARQAEAAAKAKAKAKTEPEAGDAPAREAPPAAEPLPPAREPEPAAPARDPGTREAPPPSPADHSVPTAPEPVPRSPAEPAPRAAAHPDSAPRPHPADPLPPGKSSAPHENRGEPARPRAEPRRTPADPPPGDSAAPPAPAGPDPHPADPALPHSAETPGKPARPAPHDPPQEPATRAGTPPPADAAAPPIRPLPHPEESPLPPGDAGHAPRRPASAPDHPPPPPRSPVEIHRDLEPLRNEAAGIRRLFHDDEGWHMDFGEGRTASVGSYETAAALREALTTARAENNAFHADRPAPGPGDSPPSPHTEPIPDTPGHLAATGEEQSPLLQRMSLRSSMQREHLIPDQASFWVLAEVKSIIDNLRHKELLIDAFGNERRVDFSDALDFITGSTPHHTQAQIRECVTDFLSFIPLDMLPAKSHQSAEGRLERFDIRIEAGHPNKKRSTHGTFGVDPISKKNIITLYMDAPGMHVESMVKRTIFHEMAHWLDSLDSPRIKKWRDALQEHFKEVTAGDPEGFIYNGVHCYDGGFYHLYAGRKGGIEMLPMHMELLSSPDDLLLALTEKAGAFNVSAKYNPKNTLEILRLITNLQSPHAK